MSMRYPGGLIATSPVNARYPSGVWTQAQAAPYQAQNVWTRDQFWPYTTLLLQGDGAVNGAQNNTFLDSSSNNFTITRNGNTTQGAFTPYEQDGYWSNYFNGSSNLSYTDSSQLNFGTGSYTIEFWINAPSNNDNFILGNNNTSTIQVTTGGSASTVGALRYVAGGNVTTSGSVLITDNAWHHCAIVRNGSSNVTLYVDGVSVGTGTDSTNYTSTTSTVTIAKHNSLSSNYLTGYLSNLRILKGTALYTANFTPPAAPLTAIANTSLLTCQSNRFKDNSTNAFAITVSGTPSVQAFQPFPGATTWSASVLGGSGYFDGNGDFLTFATNTAFSFGTGDFTIEFWTYTGDNSIIGGYSRNPLTIGEINFYIRIAAYHGGTDGSIVPYNVQTAANILSSTVVIKDNAWHHIAFVRESGTAKLWVDGIYQGSAALSTNFSNTNTNAIGALNSSGLGPYNGYVSNVRVVKGTAVYTGTSNITVPSSPLTAISGTSVLANFTNAGIYDNSMMNNLETVGNAQVSTSVVKYGTGSMAFDGSGDYLFAANNPSQRIMGGDFTVEMWMYLGAAQANMGLVSSYESNNGWLVRLDTTYIRFFYGISGSGTANDVTYSFSPGVWYHIAWVKSGASLRCYINGTQQGSTFTVSGAVDTATAGMQVGRTQTVSNDFNGYIDDLRITKGAARYITTFTPPPARLPAQ